MFRNIADNPLLLLVLVLLIVVIFGAKRLPDAARSLGRSMRIFKTEVKEMRDDDTARGGATKESQALEGRVVDDQRTEGYRAQEGTGGAPRADEPRRGS
ncbi:MAG: Sec-independent protein translocase subunit TatA [Actinomycetota bacterium]